MRILLTGPGGFLGSALTRHWVARGHDVWLLARPSSRLERLAELPASVTMLRAAAPDQVLTVAREAKPDVIVHTACAYGRRGETALDLLDANLGLGIALLQAALEKESGRTVFLNTCSVLGPEVSLYALSKAQFSQWGQALAHQATQQLQFVDIRLQQMYGPGDDRSKFTTHVIEACRLGEARLALTAGEQRRDFIHVDDVVSAYDTILARHAELAEVDTVDVGTGEAPRMRDFVELVHRLTNSTTTLDFGAVPYRASEPMLCVADTARMRSLGWAPRFDLQAGLRHTLSTSHAKTP
jgi:CDP-paratose synthetase